MRVCSLTTGRMHVVGGHLLACAGCVTAQPLVREVCQNFRNFMRFCEYLTQLAFIPFEKFAKLVPPASTSGLLRGSPNLSGFRNVSVVYYCGVFHY